LVAAVAAKLPRPARLPPCRRRLAMAINSARSVRRTSEYLVPKHQTSDHVAPGTYTNSYDAAFQPKGESAVPFSSLQEKVLNQNRGTSALTPGPGAYVGLGVPNGRGLKANGEEVSGLGTTSLKSKVARLAPTAPGSSEYTVSTIEKNPGPGTYNTATELMPESPKDLIRPTKPVLEAQDKTMPSIPMRKLLPGQRPTTEAAEADVANLVMRHTGDRGDTVGPGEYEPAGEALVLRTDPTTIFHMSKMTRKLWEPSVAIENTMPEKENPGPGSYEQKREFTEAVDQEIEVPSTYQFSSKTPMAHQNQVRSEKLVPGPGQYDMIAEMERQVKSARSHQGGPGDRTHFGGMSERVGWSRSVNQPYKDPYHVANVPGPGHYPDPSSAFPSDPKKKEAEKALPDAKKKKLRGVHHPSIIMALNEAQGPLQAFNTTGDRPCNKEIEQYTPAPWQYNKEDTRGHSMNSNLRERLKVGRRGVFGTCADRFYGSPLNGKAGLPDPGMDVVGMGGGGGGANTDPRSAFQSEARRFDMPAGPREVHAVKVGNTDTPAPGEYNVEKEPSYRSPFRHPRQEHLSFGSCKTRFDGNKDVFTGHQPPLLNPGPCEYEGKPLGPTSGGSTSKAKRPGTLVGCTTENVGPGSYGGSMETDMLKKTFNVSIHTMTKALIHPPATPRKGASLSMAA